MKATQKSDLSPEKRKAVGVHSLATKKLTYAAGIFKNGQKKRKKTDEGEHLEQCAFFRWFELQHPTVLAYANPNGGLRNPVVAAKLKREGVRKGVLDITVATAKQGYHGLYIEFKYGKNKLTKEQVEVKAKLDSEGYLTAVAWSWTEAAKIVNEYLGISVEESAKQFRS